MARCEDYPACGHTDGLPCDWKSPDFRDPAVAAAYHIGCDHNAGYCEYADDEDEDEDDFDDGEYILPEYLPDGDFDDLKPWHNN